MNLMGLKSPERFDSWKRHFGTSNVSFMDGHIERLTPFQLAKIGPTWRRYLPPRLQRVDYPNGRG